MVSQSGLPLALGAAFQLQNSAEFARSSLGCAQAAVAELKKCLRGLTADKIVLAQLAAAGTGSLINNPGWNPTVDGAGGSLPDDPRGLFNRGALHAGIESFVAGSTSNEGTMFVLPFYPDGIAGPKDFNTYIKLLFNKDGTVLSAAEIAEIEAVYVCGAGEDCAGLASSVFADIFVAGTRLALRGAEAPLKGNTYMYVRRADWRSWSCPPAPVRWPGPGAVCGARCRRVSTKGSPMGN